MFSQLKKIGFFFFLILAAIEAAADYNVIYGQDNRHDLYEIKDPKILQLARSTVALIHTDFVSKGSAGRVKIQTDEIENICPDERFSQQHVAADCTGFLVDRDVVLTAGHCLKSKSQCHKTKFVFDFAIYERSQNYKDLPAENTYNCEKLIYTSTPKVDGGGLDLAIVKLSKPVIDRQPLALETSSKLKVGDQLFVLGHPLGLPMKFADDARVLSFFNKSYFNADVDAYKGNSGSPVFNIGTGKVEGILISGEDDFPKPSKNQCVRSTICDSDCDGELVLKIGSVLEQLPLF